MGMFKFNNLDHLLNVAVESVGELLAGGFDMGEVLFDAAVFLEGNDESSVIVRPTSMYPVFVKIERMEDVADLGYDDVDNVVNGIKYVDLFEIEAIQADIASFEFYSMKDGRQYPAYIDGERNILTPALEKAGYILSESGWFTGEGDSFGPLTRCIGAFSPDAESIVIVYG